MRDGKPVSEEDIYMYVVLTLFLLMDIPQNPVIKIVFKEKSVLATSIFYSVTSIGRF
jgi:hypothetical protein